MQKKSRVQPTVSKQINLFPLVGKFHTTRIWEFSMRCHRCSNKIVCRTDPENTDYKFVEGAEKWVYFFDSCAEGNNNLFSSQLKRLLMLNGCQNPMK